MGQADTAQDLWENCAFLEQLSEIPCASSLTESSLLGGNKFTVTFYVLLKSEHLLLWVRKQEAKQIIK